jgi:leader peptidase (prepilin peptidase)/N-methyltransferase
VAPGFIVPLFTGLALGWIANYLADVLPNTRRLSRPVCLQCASPLPWQDYLLLRRCRSCGTPRRARAWIVPLLLTAIIVYTWFSPPPHVGFVPGSVLLLYFTTVFLIDLEHRLILHPTSIVGAALGLWIGFLRWGWGPTLTGGLAGFAIMFAVYLFGILFTRWRARRLRAAGEPDDDEDAFGQGDVILGTILGLTLGWPLIWFGMLFAVLLGGAVSILMMLARLLSGRFRENSWMVFIPYGPFMIVSAFLLIYFPAWMKMLVPS